LLWRSCLGPVSAQERPPAAPGQLLSLAEARAIIDGAIAYSRAKNTTMGVAVVDVGGDILSSDRMDGGSSRNVRFAEAKAFASAMYRQTTETLSALYKTRPDRYFGIMNMYGNKVYLVGGGVPIALDGKLVGRRCRLAAGRRRECRSGRHRGLGENAGEPAQIVPDGVARPVAICRPLKRSGALGRAPRFAFRPR
jgi:uncharacterized protein GlcG (DUF336 family)